MRYMPKIVHGFNGEGIEMTSIPNEEWDKRLSEMVGRALTAKESARADTMASHGWTLTVVADALKGGK